MIDYEALRARLDRGGMYARLAGFPQQLLAGDRSARAAAAAVREAPDSVVIAGMGGSAIAGDIAARLADVRSRIPVTVSRDYSLPNHVSRRTLVIASSYSGNTEETLAAHADARRRRARVVCLTTGGELARLAMAAGEPLVRLPPGMPPRTALGVSLTALLRLLERAGVLSNVSSDVEEAYRTTARILTLCRIERSGRANPAQALAESFGRWRPLVLATPAVAPAGFRWQTQINENAKALCEFNVLPEANHNVLVAFDRRTAPARDTFVALLTEARPSPALARRVRATVALVRPVARGIRVFAAFGRSPLAQMLSHVVLGDWMSYYLALRRGVDPTPVRIIDRLKAALARR